MTHAEAMKALERLRATSRAALKQRCWRREYHQQRVDALTIAIEALAGSRRAWPSPVRPR